jgi:hypothetical protein
MFIQVSKYSISYTKTEDPTDESYLWYFSTKLNKCPLGPCLAVFANLGT